MKKILVSIMLVLAISVVYSQSNEVLKSQLAYCKKESAKSEASLETYKTLLEIQGTQIMELKTTIQAQEVTINNLKTENTQLQSVAMSLLELGAKYEELGKFQEAIEIYKLLMKSYPSSMEAIASKLKIIDLKKREKLNVSPK